MERAAMSPRTTAVHFLQPIKMAVGVAALTGQQLTLAHLKAEFRIELYPGAVGAISTCTFNHLSFCQQQNSLTATLIQTTLDLPTRLNQKSTNNGCMIVFYSP